MNRPWTTKEHAAFVEMYPFFPNPYIGKKLNRSSSAISQRARKFGIKKDPDFKDEGVLFLKGQVPWNKGKKHSPPGSEKGRFKKGHNIDRSKPIGYKRIRAGVLEIKINDFHGPAHSKNFKAVKNITWEKHKGPIPKGMIIRVMTGNPKDAKKIEHLSCITRAENFRINAKKGKAEKKSGIADKQKISNRLR